MIRTRWVLAGVFVFALPAFAQTSPSFNLEEYRLNQGGNPDGGVILQSGSFRVTLDAVGDSVGGATLSGTSFQLDPSVAESARPPEEVLNLRFTSKSSLAWDTERSVGSYVLYRASDPQGFATPAFCQQALTSPAGSDANTPVPGPGPGSCFFYLVTAKNRLGQEGTSGSNSAGAPRPAPGPCP